MRLEMLLKQFAAAEVNVVAYYAAVDEWLVVAVVGNFVFYEG
jgi:hypothetical protein